VSIYKSGYVAIVGKPNVGKSTLMNLFLGEKLSIVTSKPGTTRDKIIGILNRPSGQIIFIDTPGLHRPKVALGRHMLQEAQSSLVEADLVLLMTDVGSGFESADMEFIKLIRKTQKPAFSLINKVDVAKKSRVLPLIEEALRLHPFKEIMPISCQTGDNIARLLDLIIEHLPVGEPYYPDGDLTDKPERFFVSERVREKVLEFLKEEVPHSVAVMVEEMKDKPENDICVIKATVYVERDSQKAILIGQKGQMLKKIGETSRKEIEDFLSKKVFLELWVKVLKDWRKDERALKFLGYRSS
jgi:GTP-binding protein Era